MGAIRETEWRVTLLVAVQSPSENQASRWGQRLTAAHNHHWKVGEERVARPTASTLKSQNPQGGGMSGRHFERPEWCRNEQSVGPKEFGHDNGVVAQFEQS